MVPSFQLINVLYLQPWALFASSSSIDRTLSSDSWVQVLTHPHPHTHTHTQTHTRANIYEHFHSQSETEDTQRKEDRNGQTCIQPCFDIFI
jgi:hypothetical protein